MVVVLAALGTAPVAARQPTDATGVSSRSAEARGRGTLLDITPVSGPYDIEHAAMPALFDGRVNDGSTDHNATYMKSGPQIVRWCDAVAARS